MSNSLALRARRQRAALTLALCTTLGLGPATLGCGGSPAGIDASFTAVGTVRRGLEGCFVLVTSGATYLPRDLPGDFAREGLRVSFTARPIDPPGFTICGGEQRIELLRIRAIL